MGNLIKPVRGNWFKLVQPLEKIKWESSEGTVVDYEPAEGDTFKVELVGAYNHYNMEKVQIELNPENNKRNLLTYENNGTLPLGLYDIEISVTLADGKRLHSCQPKRVKIVKTNSEASIPDYVEFGIETFTLQGEPFMYVPNGEGGGDMSNYYTKTESDARFLSNSTPIPSASDTTHLMDGVGNSGSASTFARADHRHPSDTTKQDVINDIADIRSGAGKGATAYQKPSSGIPKTDLASDVQTSLGKADNAIQKSSSSTGLLKPNGDVDTTAYLTQHQDISGKANTSDLADVAFSGDYDDLENKPTIPTLPTLATVATSGSYNDLSDTPIIPIVPTISTDVSADESSDVKTASPKAVKTYVDGICGTILTRLQGI
jgi:hypothetical protein